MNKVFLIGRLTADPKLSKTIDGKAYTKFQLAVNRFGGDNADFIGIVAWEKTAESIVKYVTKGRQISLVGNIKTGSYERDGVKRSTFDVVAEQVEFIGSSNTTTGNGDSATTRRDKDASIDNLQETDDDDMPF